MLGDLCQILKDSLFYVKVGLGHRELEDLEELAQDRLIIKVDYELRVDHHPQSGHGISNLLLLVAIGISEYGIDLAENLHEVLSLLFIAIQLSE
jgi:hypothetical protein